MFDMRMKRVDAIRTAAIVALLLPGLAIAAPIAGPCGFCGDGNSCHMQRSVEPKAEAHSCCGSAPENPSPEASLASSNCECGRNAPPALTNDTPAQDERAFAEKEIADAIDPTPTIQSHFVRSARPPAPPPTPPAYLIDCAFLT